MPTLASDVFRTISPHNGVFSMTTDSSVSNISVSTPKLLHSPTTSSPLATQITTVLVAVVAATVMVAIVVGLLARRYHEKKSPSKNQVVIAGPNVDAPGTTETRINDGAPYAITETVVGLPRFDGCTLNVDSAYVSQSASCLVLEDGKSVTVSPPCKHSSRPRSVGNYDRQALSLVGNRLHVAPSEESGFFSTTSLAQPSDEIHSQKEVLNTYRRVLEECLEDGIKDLLLYHQTPGQFYASGLMAVGLFDRHGGALKLSSDDAIQLYIPEGALTRPRIIYLIVKCDKAADCHITSFSPIIECGPDGTQFEVPVQLTFPHAAVNASIKAVTRDSKTSGWTEEVEVDNETDGHITLNINHFSDFMVTEAANTSDQVNSQTYKKLAFNVYVKGPEMRFYMVLEQPTELRKRVDDQMSRRGYSSKDDWKTFHFQWNLGVLMFEKGLDTEIHLFRPLSESKIKNLQQDYLSWELPEQEGKSTFDLLVYQSSEPNDYIQFHIKLAHQQLQQQQQFLQQQQLQQQQLQQQQLQQIIPPRHQNQPDRPYFDRPFRREPTENGYQPCESCSCPGACSCETEIRVITRGDMNRRSGESGYVSEVASPLRGPLTLQRSESDGEELSLTELDNSIKYKPPNT